jgi:hypothetical protein
MLSGIPAATHAGTTEGRPAAGAYCPLPEAGQKPVCLSPAEDRYGEFFAAVEGGHIADADAANVEADLSSGFGSQRAYLALSSISYGYWRLATRIARAPDADPALRERLSHWNAVLLAAYSKSQSDPLFSDALRTAALDLQSRSPQRGSDCEAAEECEPAEVLVRTLAAFDANSGLRAPLEQLIQRFQGGPEDETRVTRPVGDRQ